MRSRWAALGRPHGKAGRSRGRGAAHLRKNSLSPWERAGVRATTTTSSHRLFLSSHRGHPVPMVGTGKKGTRRAGETRCPHGPRTFAKAPIPCGDLCKNSLSPWERAGVRATTTTSSHRLLLSSHRGHPVPMVGSGGRVPSYRGNPVPTRFAHLRKNSLSPWERVGVRATTPT